MGGLQSKTDLDLLPICLQVVEDELPLTPPAVDAP